MKKRHLLVYLWNKCLAAFKPTYLKVRFNKIGDVADIKYRKNKSEWQGYYVKIVERKAKTMTSNLPILSVLAVGLILRV